MIWFVDFVANGTFDLVLAGIRDGKVALAASSATSSIGTLPAIIVSRLQERCFAI